ncbi:MAG: hypothetical protein V4564_19665 [Pseudomonadota bacterium]
MPSKTPRRPDKPVFWIVAGPNGSGKSSLYNRTDIEGWGGSVWIINPDLLTAKIVEQEGHLPDAANLVAVQRSRHGSMHRSTPIRRSVSKPCSPHPNIGGSSIGPRIAGSRCA